MSSRTRATAGHGSTADLPDLNVWLALAVREHVHHSAASQYWAGAAAPQVRFCRITMLGMVRLLTQSRLMGPGALGASAALAVYESFVALAGVDLGPEPPGTSGVMRDLVDADLPSRLLTDAYLAAVAIAGGFRLVTFDRDFRRFRGLDLLLLSPAAVAP